jgi:tetraacyldisaccharide 4'-kinase
MSFSLSLERAWNRRFSWTLLLLPLSWLFRILVSLRRYYVTKLTLNSALKVPVVVVGNISVGGTGKTPLLMTLVHHFQGQGYRPGVISRGFGGTSAQYPLLVTPESSATEAGDEPLLLASLCPVIVDPDRYRAAQSLLEQTDCDLILSDDGLQHYRLPRDIEIVVVDGKRGFGNGQCLPAGPLREPVSRLKQVDFILTNGQSTGPKEAKPARSEDGRLKNSFAMSIEPLQLRHLVSQRICNITCDVTNETKLEQWQYGYNVHAVAGIGNPQRFVTTLEQLGFNVQLHAWPDHHNFNGEEFKFEDDLPVIITAKDAVKCANIANDPLLIDKIWILDVKALPDTAFLKKLTDRVSDLKPANQAIFTDQTKPTD